MTDEMFDLLLFLLSKLKEARCRPMFVDISDRSEVFEFRVSFRRRQCGPVETLYVHLYDDTSIGSPARYRLLHGSEPYRGDAATMRKAIERVI